MQIIQTVQRYKGVSLDLLKGNLKYNDKEIELTKNEFHILKLMMYNKGRIVSRDEIMDELWQSDEFVDDNTIQLSSYSFAVLDYLVDYIHFKTDGENFLSMPEKSIYS